MTRIKICGITNEDDARAAVSYGANALGFNLVPESPRFITDQAYHALVSKTRLYVSRVAVVRRPEDADEYHSDYVQFSEESSGPNTWKWEAQRYVRTFRMKDATNLEEIGRYAYSAGMTAYLLDAYHKDRLGGVGETFNWDLAIEAKKLTDKPIILAGGLTPENVQDAIAKVKPYAVDVASGVEAEPGRKDHAKLKAFIRAVREYDLKFGE